MLCDALPGPARMQATAAGVGYSETAFAALAGYLRDLGWPHGGAIEAPQGADMGAPCRLHAEITHEAGASVRVWGWTRRI